MKTNYWAVMAVFAQLYSYQAFAGNEHDHGGNGPNFAEKHRSKLNHEPVSDEQLNEKKSREIGSVPDRSKEMTSTAEEKFEDEKSHRKGFDHQGMLRSQ